MNGGVSCAHKIIPQSVEGVSFRAGDDKGSDPEEEEEELIRSKIVEKLHDKRYRMRKVMTEESI